ncbi:MAG: DUF748 domain-containing protein [Burkholderiales bacterium]|nr:DUF748 domain-containing protein [Burkholderiales bacterium]
MNPSPRLRRIAAAGVALVVLLALLAFALPPWLKGYAERQATAALGRRVTIAALQLEPWRLGVGVSGLAIAPAVAASAAAPQFSVARAHVRIALASLWRRAPVIAAVEVDGLRAQIARTAPGHYDIDDLIERFSAGPPAPPDAPPARYAIHNLQLRDAALTFDDRPLAHVHHLDALTLALPFLSTLPADVATEVEPRLAFKLDGTAFDSGAQARPFAVTREGRISLAFAGFDLAPWLGYLPATLPVQVRRGHVGADLQLSFKQPEGASPQVVLAGRVNVDDAALADARGAPLAQWQGLKVELKDVQPLAHRVALGTVTADGLEVDVARATDGGINWARLGGAPAAASAASAAPAPSAAAASAAAAAPAAAPAAPWSVAVAQAEIHRGTLRWTDAGVGAALTLGAIEIGAQRIDWPLKSPVPFTLATVLQSSAGKDAVKGADPGAAGTLRAQGRASDREVQIELHLAGLRAQALAAYLRPVLKPAVAGTLSANGEFRWAGGERPVLALALQDATLAGLRIAPADAAPATLRRLALGPAKLDFEARQLAFDRIEIDRPALEVARDAAGRLNLLQWLTPSAPSAPSMRSHTPPPPAAKPWRIAVAALALDGGSVDYRDASVAGGAPLKLRIDAARIHAQALAWPTAQPFKLQLGARVGAPALRASASTEPVAPAGRIDWKGRVGLAPSLAQGQLQVEHLPLQPFAPYYASLMPLELARASVDYRGAVDLRQAPAGWQAHVGGDVDLRQLLLRNLPAAGAAAGSGDPLLAWQDLALHGADFVLAPGAKPRLTLATALLSDFYARLLVTEQGRFNLQQVAASQPPSASDAASSPASAAAATAPASAVLPVVSGKGKAQVAPQALPIALAIGSTKIAGGTVDYTDHFVKPNFSTKLTELNGELGAFSSESAALAPLQIHGRAGGTATLDIEGQLNPTANPPAMDLTAQATDLELAPLSPYSGKYFGYAIERGKLSAKLHYVITPQGRLDATNQVIVHQLTFGAKVDSPTATSLPVRLAVALLQDRNGVIDLDLPVSGSLEDPKFSLGGLIWKVVVNLFTKALTSPFSLLAGGGGADGVDLSAVAFDAGSALPNAGGRATIAKLAKALTERPALQLTIIGGADATAEAPAMQQVALDARLLTMRRRELARSGATVAPDLSLTAVDRNRLLAQLYDETPLPDKPRNLLGFASKLPAAEEERRLRAVLRTDADAARALALQRSMAVRDALIAQGLPSARLFLGAPALHEGDQPWTPQVRLELSHG